MTTKISREKVDNDLYTFLRTIYHYERNIAAQFGLDYQEIYLLQSLRRTSPQRLTEIAAVLDIPMFSASRLVERLAQKHLVSKEKGTSDRRSISVLLLPEGEKVVLAVENESYARIVQNSQEMSAEEIDSLFHMAESVHKILGIPQSRIQ
ncbi:MAG: MarR family winged helix-turn-helix transcriptional regulator [Clostridiaceae bacterium]